MMLSVMHTDSMETVSCFPYGVVAGVMRVKMREFWPCMLMHLLWSAAWGLLRAGRRPTLAVRSAQHG